MEKVGSLLGEVADGYRERAAHAAALTPELKGRFPKLSRGENYQGLPYMILDYPAVFDRDHVFAIRTLFWWGRYFSLTLHLKGRYQARYVPALLDVLGSRETGNWHLAVSEDEWVHAVRESDYRRVQELSEAQRAEQGDRVFFKMVTVIPLDLWDQVPGLLEERFGELLGWMG